MHAISFAETPRRADGFDCASVSIVMALIYPVIIACNWLITNTARTQRHEYDVVIGYYLEVFLYQQCAFPNIVGTGTKKMIAIAMPDNEPEVSSIQ